MRIQISMAALAAILIACGARAASMPTVALVHGAWETPGIWQGVEAKLKSDGYKVIVVTLPGRPGNPLPADKLTLDLYRDTVLKAVAEERDPVVLVGHSFAGFPISAAAEAAPEKIKTLVYVAAYLPKDGQTLLDLGNSDKDSKIGPHLLVMKDKGVIVIEYGARADLFCNDCPPEVRKALPDQIVDEPLGPLVTPIHLTAANFGKVDKVYIHTAKDQVVSPWLQDQMVAATPVRLALTEDTGHTAFITDPVGLAENIEKASH